MAGRGRGRILSLVTAQEDDRNGREYMNLSIDDLMMGRGKSAGTSFHDATNMSLDEMIRNKKQSSQRQKRNQKTFSTMSMAEMMGFHEDAVDCAPSSSDRKYSVEVQGTLGARNTQGQMRDYNEDVFKSLDEVVHERGILQPPKSSPHQDDDLPITGARKGGKVRQERRLVPRPVTAQLDPKSSALDDIIKERRDVDGEGTGNAQRSKRRFRNEEGMDVDADGTFKQRRRTFTPNFVFTPYRAMSVLGEKGMIIDLKIGLKVAETEADEDPLRKWRCIIQCGSIKGIADSNRKVVSREMACDLFMKNLKEAYPDGKIPNYEVPDDLFLDPKVQSDLEKLGKESGTDIFFEFTVDSPGEGTNRRQNSFTCVYHVGDQEFVGRSSDKKYAQIKAACQAYEFLTGEAFPKTCYFADEECDMNVDYNFNESEVYQTISRTEKELKEDGDSEVSTLLAFNEEREEALKLTRQELSKLF